MARPWRRCPPTVRERGSVSLELVIVFPALLLLIVALVQYALWFHARSLALAAAQQGVSIARAYGSSLHAGQDAALAFIATQGPDTLLSADAQASAPVAGQVQLVVSGRSVSVLPGLAGLTVTQAASGPIERFTTAETP